MVCQAALAGLYNVNDSRTVLRNIDSQAAAVWEWGSASALNQTGVAEEVVDTMGIETEQGLITVDNSTISAAHREYFEIPSGFSYTPQMGILSLVKEETVQNISTTSLAKTFLATLLRRTLRL